MRSLGSYTSIDGKPGYFLCQPGDHLIPVMTYCMKSTASSPDAHRYTLAKLQGSKAHIIKDLNLRAPAKFSQSEIQTLSWSIQNGIPYERFNETSKKVSDEFLPEHRQELGKDLFTQLEEKWNQTAKVVPGLPNADEAFNLAIVRMGEAGTWLQEIRRVREEVRKNGASYETFANPISLPGLSTLRGDASTTVITALVGAALAASNWDYLEDAANKIGNTTDKDLRDLADQIGRMFSDKHDELEKPAREIGVLEGAEQIEEGGDSRARNYKKPSGKEARDKDFEKFPGKTEHHPDGLEMKILPDGRKIISRGSTSGLLTIEIQPSTGNKPSIKIRYPE